MISVLVGGISDARSGAKPNLKVASLHASTTTLVPGAKLSVTDATVNGGPGKAGKSSTAFFLSGDARKDSRDRRLGAHVVAALEAGKRAKRTTSLVIPGAQAVGRYRLIGCADARLKVRETNERDNCRVAAAPISVTKRADQPQPAPEPEAPAPAPAPPEPPAPTPPAPPADTSAQIQALRGAADGAVSLPVTDAVVTYMKAAVGTDAPGFFIQAAQAGPALFIAVDPATVSPAPAAGDRVSFTVTSMGTVGGLREATTIASFTRTETGVSLAPLTQAVSSATDLVSALGSYESELVSLNGTVAGAFTASGAGHESAPIDTAGIAGDANLRLRLPAPLRDSLDLASGCTFALDAGPVWRFNGVAEPSAYSASDLTPLACPAPTVVSATATSSTSVTVTFARRIEPTSVAANGSQFTADNGLTFSAAVVSGRSVTLTSSAQSVGTTYTVTAAGTVTDLLGAGIGVPNSATFDGFESPAQLVLNEVGPNITGGHDLIELRAISGGTVKDFTLIMDPAPSAPQTLATFPQITVSAGDLIVVHLVPGVANGDAPASETSSKTEYAHATYSANYDSAWDVQGGATGVTFSDRVLEVRGSAGQVQDAVAFVRPASADRSSFPPEVQALLTSGDWTGSCGSPCDYSSLPSVVDISVDWSAVGSTSATSVRRNGNDTNANVDWNVAASTFGAAN